MAQTSEAVVRSVLVKTHAVAGAFPSSSWPFASEGEGAFRKNASQLLLPLS